MTTLHRIAARAAQAWSDRGVLLKAASFALIGVFNAVIDASVFFLAYFALGASIAASGRLIVANIIAWLVAVSGSYVMNSFITFAAESGRRLRRRDYLTFVVSGIAGMIANTAVLVLAAQAMPVWSAKGLAILASFVVNFSLSHFLVFRPRKSKTQ
ncbi:MAG: GtrA family protein [Rhizobiales bacterium]|nr:GtrA family protein [Hyphomicrobiales bacterium]